MDPVAQEEFYRALLMTSARGHTQRASTETRAREPHGDPACADNLLTQWGYVCYSAQETQKLAHLTRKAGAIDGYLKDLAALGSHGEHPKNMSTELMDLIRKVLGRAIIPIYVAFAPMFVAKADRILHAVRRLRKRQRRRKTQEVLGVISPIRPSPTAVL